jgi:hypothetical protein
LQEGRHKPLPADSQASSASRPTRVPLAIPWVYQIGIDFSLAQNTSQPASLLIPGNAQSETLKPGGTLVQNVVSFTIDRPGSTPCSTCSVSHRSMRVYTGSAQARACPVCSRLWEQRFLQQTFSYQSAMSLRWLTSSSRRDLKQTTTTGSTFSAVRGIGSLCRRDSLPCPHSLLNVQS